MSKPLIALSHLNSKSTHCRKKVLLTDQPISCATCIDTACLIWNRKINSTQWGQSGYRNRYFTATGRAPIDISNAILKGMITSNAAGDISDDPCVCINRYNTQSCILNDTKSIGRNSHIPNKIIRQKHLMSHFQMYSPKQYLAPTEVVYLSVAHGLMRDKN
ncbi:MAG: hypothetical protein ACI9FB_002386 [Candidatus Azotimanducaceae bacterium]|jgi:hypothetical protein